MATFSNKNLIYISVKVGGMRVVKHPHHPKEEKPQTKDEKEQQEEEFQTEK